MYYASSSDRVLCFVVANCAKAGTSAAAVGRDAYLCISVPGIRRFRSFRGPLSAVSEPIFESKYVFSVFCFHNNKSSKSSGSIFKIWQENLQKLQNFNESKTESSEILNFFDFALRCHQIRLFFAKLLLEY